jgi:glycosyltransferase involved in cell wall biosynthesis
MKVALVASSFLPEAGRLERRVDQLARGLAQRGAEVEILTQGCGHPLVEQHERLTIRRVPNGVGRVRVAVAPRFWEQLRLSSRAFDLVDVHTRQVSLALAVASARVRRLVLTPAVPLDVFFGGPGTRATRTLIASSGHIVCRSEIERAAICRAIPEVVHRTHVVPDGVDVVALRAAEPFQTTGIVVLSADRLDRATGVGRVIAAMPSLDPEFRLVVVGDGPARDRLSAFAADMRISSRVEFVGAVPDPVYYRWLRTARVVVALPAERTSGALVTEARAAGVSVVASDLPIHRQAAEQPGSGEMILVSPRSSPIDVADAIEEVARLPVIPETELVAGAATSWESVVDATWRLYRRVIAGSLRSQADRAHSQVLDLTSRLQTGDGSLPDGVISATARGDANPASGNPWWQTRLRLEGRMNGARRWS